jgi:hypothetical protein
MVDTLPPVSSHDRGKSIPDPGFAGDDGAADAALAAALAAATADPAQLPLVLAALHRARVLAPVVAVVGEQETTAAGLVRDKTSDIAMPLLLDDGGRRALPVFTDVAALARWDPGARPVPVAGPRAAQVAIAEQAEAMVIDVGSPTPVTLLLPEVRALAEGRGSRPAWDDPEVSAGIAAVLAGEPQVRSAELGPCAGRDGRVNVLADPEADHAALAGRVAAAVAALPVVRRGVRGLEVTIS